MTGKKARGTLDLDQELESPVHGFEVGEGPSVSRLLQDWVNNGEQHRWRKLPTQVPSWYGHWRSQVESVCRYQWLIQRNGGSLEGRAKRVHRKDQRLVYTKVVVESLENGCFFRFSIFLGCTLKSFMCALSDIF